MLKKCVPLWSIVLLMIFSVGTVWLRLTMIRMTYETSELNTRMDEIRQERERLQVKLAALKSPKRLELLARTQFSLGQPRMEQIIHLATPGVRDKLK